MDTEIDVGPSQPNHAYSQEFLELIATHPEKIPGSYWQLNGYAWNNMGSDGIRFSDRPFGTYRQNLLVSIESAGQKTSERGNPIIYLVMYVLDRPLYAYLHEVDLTPHPGPWSRCGCLPSED